MLLDWFEQYEIWLLRLGRFPVAFGELFLEFSERSGFELADLDTPPNQTVKKETISFVPFFQVPKWTTTILSSVISSTA